MVRVIVKLAANKVGFGKLTSPDGSYFHGRFIFGKKDGLGTYYVQGQKPRIGQWKETEDGTYLIGTKENILI